MIWHYLKEAIGIVVIVHGLHGLLHFRHAAKAGDFRRVWNWPMRVAVSCLLLFGVLGWVSSWGILHSGPLSCFMTYLRTTAFVALGVGIAALFVFLPVFLITILGDFQPKQRLPQASEDIDKVQNLILEGNRDAAVKMYQQLNKVDAHEAQEAVEAIHEALQSGLQV